MHSCVMCLYDRLFRNNRTIDTLAITSPGVSYVAGYFDLGLLQMKIKIVYYTDNCTAA